MEPVRPISGALNAVKARSTSAAMCGKSSTHTPTQAAHRRRCARQTQMHRSNVGRSRESPLAFCVAGVLCSALGRTSPARATRCAANLAPQQRPPSHPRVGESHQTQPRKADFLSGVRGRFLCARAKKAPPEKAAVGTTPSAPPGIRVSPSRRRVPPPQTPWTRRAARRCQV